MEGWRHVLSVGVEGVACFEWRGGGGGVEACFECEGGGVEGWRHVLSVGVEGGGMF